MKRSCGTCTKCCEGYLPSTVKGRPFYKGKPCHFIEIGKGCTIYPERPVDPCVVYKCLWLTDDEVPTWMKPNEIDAIIDQRQISGISYINIVEAGKTLDSRVLSWVITDLIPQGKNVKWELDNGYNWFGSPEFLKAMNEFMAPKAPK